MKLNPQSWKDYGKYQSGKFESAAMDDDLNTADAISSGIRADHSDINTACEETERQQRIRGRMSWSS